MTSPDDTYALLGAFVDELARCGMRAACTSPGSRCAPLVLSLANEPRIRCFSHVDERCAGFFALGHAKASGLPVAVACTSGTAAAELMPSVIEAREARAPMIVLTADRPPELRDVGAGQTIDQLKLYGAAAKWFVEVGLERCDPPRLRWLRTLACRAYWTALECRPGVVHLNFPLCEPLVCDGQPPPAGGGRPAGAPYLVRSTAPRDHAAASPLAALVDASRRALVVAGRHERPPAPGSAPPGEVTARMCAQLGWPLLADPLSGARRGEAAIAHYDALLRDEAFAASVTPDLVLRIGDLPVSKPLRTWLAALPDAAQVAIDPEGAWQDPAGVLSHSLALDPGAALALALDAVSAVQEGWLQSWRSADARGAEAILGALAGEQLSEPVIARELGVLLPSQATLFVASSMPVREIESFWPARADPPRVLCNRGASGIDGTVSSAFGAAAACAGPVVLLIGDVALAHDIGGLLAASRLGLKLTIVLVDNAGGGIFDFLPVARAPMAREGDVYTDHVATPTGLDFARAADLYGLAHESVRDVFELREALERALAAPGPCIVHARTERGANVALHERVWSAVARALSA
ncbi:MAG TPA: 2-succinyl-5-enolpyruvyl-6-hydroxy-3-cyclohexene-1-carboxylic-acid synthase [Solirubrobacteraceae bacterium]|nr:2-succinyl-5-enolpyruvyl-6-hydroxy-3-cyclohexene-1-carboxylic-acid synthase [Solirubrobacteraceae bacterium]